MIYEFSSQLTSLHIFPQHPPPSSFLMKSIEERNVCSEQSAVHLSTSSRDVSCLTIVRLQASAVTWIYGFPGDRKYFRKTVTDLQQRIFPRVFF